MSPPNRSLENEGCEIRSPIAPSPAIALFQIFEIVFQRSLNLAAVVELNPGFPSVVDHPAGEEIVVIRIELTRSPRLMCERMFEFCILQDMCPVGHSPPGETRKPAVNE